MHSQPSGLFLKNHTHCEIKLQPSLLHTLVLVAFHLVQSGSEDEDLFGIIAVLLELLGNGASPILTAEVSRSLLLGVGDVDECDHKALSALELARDLSPYSELARSVDTKVRWEILCQILQQAEYVHREDEFERSDSSGDDEDLNDANSIIDRRISASVES
jgi:hypothetical protein